MHDAAVNDAQLIATQGLTKRYRRFVALDRCTLSIAAGEVFGLLGPNGAGKTTLIRLLLGLLRPSAGSARVSGFDCQRENLQVRRRVSYLPGEAQLFRAMRGRDVLRFFANLRGDDPASALAIAQRLDLDLTRRVAYMSTGMRQKLALASTLAGNTPVVILDEPTSNLDPSARAIVLDLVREAQAAGRTVLFSSHVMAEVEEVCDRVGMLRGGKLVHVQPMAELRRRHRIVARLSGPLPPLPAELTTTVKVYENEHSELLLESSGDLPALLLWLSSTPLAEMRVDPVGLRSVYDTYLQDQRATS